MHGYVPKRKKNAQDGQMSNESDESVANSFAESTIAIDRLQVAISKDGNTWIKLPRIYTRKHLPIDKKEVATPEKIEVLKVIASNNGGTYAYQTRLAWCIVEVTWLAKIQLVATVLQYMIK